MRCSLWPAKYWAQVRCQKKGQDGEKPAWMAFGLPHEIMEALVKHGDLNTILQTSSMDPVSLEHLEEAAKDLPGCDLAGLGL